MIKLDKSFNQYFNQLNTNASIIYRRPANDVAGL